MKNLDILEHDEWAHCQPKTRTAGKVEIGNVFGVLPFDGVRNPLTTSSHSQKIAFKYKTEANEWRPKIGLAESGAELAVSHELLLLPKTFNVEFQPVCFPFINSLGLKRDHTIDIRLTLKSGMRVFIFVRNANSLKKRETWADIAAIRDAVPQSEAHKFMIVDASAFGRPRRDNLRRIHFSSMFEADPEADAETLWVAKKIKTLWRISDLFDYSELLAGRIYKSCLRLIGRGALQADKNAVIGPHSRIWI
ncbi:MAG: hypothetical protein AAGF94_06025 [Pseudomonadota bacterium]